MSSFQPKSTEFLLPTRSMKNGNSFICSSLLLIFFAGLIFAEDVLFGLRPEDSFDYLEPLKSSSAEKSLFSQDEVLSDKGIRGNEDEATEKRSVTLYLLARIYSVNESLFFPRLIVLGITRHRKHLDNYRKRYKCNNQRSRSIVSRSNVGEQ